MTLKTWGKVKILYMTHLLLDVNICMKYESIPAVEGKFAADKVSSTDRRTDGWRDKIKPI